MDIRIEIDEKEVRRLVLARLSEMLGEIELDPASVVIETKSKQNWRSEWEPAAFRAVYTKSA